MRHDFIMWTYAECAIYDNPTKGIENKSVFDEKK